MASATISFSSASPGSVTASTVRHAESRRPANRRPTELFPDRHVLAALAGERLPPPSAPPLAEPHPRQLRHQVQLRGPDVPERDRGVLAPAVDDLDVVGAHRLR